MDIDISKYSIGVMVARFQIHDLHEGHHHVIKQVIQNHKKTIIFLGVPRFIGTKKNPLDFDTRKKMVQTDYPDAIILAIQDQSDNSRWASELDRRIREVYPHGDVLLYGGRDSFIPHYINGGGKFQTKELTSLGTYAGTDVRKLVSEEVKNSKDFRSGVIYHAYNLHTRTIPTVDVIPINSENQVLLARKWDELKWRFIGGFVLTQDESIESAAKRVFSKEAGSSDTSDYKYIGSCQVPDWRFRGEDDKVMTSIVTCRYNWGIIQPLDDIVELKWMSINDITGDIIMNDHKNVLEIFKKSIK
jgi:bifunctional NMN adenylyltransferase/nudix hydrolase